MILNGWTKADGADIAHLDPQFDNPKWMLVASLLREYFGVAPVVTAGACSAGHSAGSMHYRGLAIDVRSRDLTADQRTQAGELMAWLLGDPWCVVLEKDHYHIQWSNKNIKSGSMFKPLGGGRFYFP